MRYEIGDHGFAIVKNDQAYIDRMLQTIEYGTVLDEALSLQGSLVIMLMTILFIYF